MKKFGLLLLVLLAATATMAKTRQWQTGKIELTSETDVSWKLWGEKNTLHYTIETEQMIYFAEYVYKPGQHGDPHPPDVTANPFSRIAIEGRHAYVLDSNGKEVKFHIVKKIAKK
jgi:hypothetical protein